MLGVAGGQVEVVQHDDHRPPLALVEVGQQVEHLDLVRQVREGGGFVEQQQVRSLSGARPAKHPNVRSHRGPSEHKMPGQSRDPAHKATPDTAAGTTGASRAERRIRGRTLAERREERRDAMLAAGLDLFGTKGYAATTVEEVCRRAYASSRNFYEEFDNRLGLLVAVGERIVAAALAAWTATGGPGEQGVGTLRGRVGSLVHTLVDDPRVTRVAFIETVGIDPAHEALRREMLGVFPAGSRRTCRATSTPWASRPGASAAWRWACSGPSRS